MRELLSGVAMFAVALTSLVPATAQEQQMQVGVAVESILPDPPEGQWLAGLGRPEDQRVSEGYHDGIDCRAMAISDGETTIVLAVVDLIGLFRPDIDRIRDGVAGVPRDNIIIAATHVHSAPDTLGLWGPAYGVSGVDPDYLAFVLERSTVAIIRAIEALEPAEIRFAEGWSPPRTSRNYRDTEIKDDQISILQAVRPNGEVIGTLINWACHPEVVWTDNRLITSDFAHFLREDVEATQGGTALYFNGALGGMVSPDRTERTFEETERIGRAVGEEVNRALAEAVPMEPSPIYLTSERFVIPVSSARIEALVASGAINRNDPDEPEGAVITEATAFVLGPSQWVTMPGEALPAVGFLAKTMMDRGFRFLLGLAHDELGYILPDEAQGLHKYRYELEMGVNSRANQYIMPVLSRLLLEARTRAGLVEP